MVQFFKGSQDPRDASYGALAQALGQGLGKGITTHFANKDLQEVLNDESLKNAPISAKMGALHSKLYQYGDVGKELLQNTFQIEQQAYNEQQAKEQKQETREKENRLFSHQKALQEQKDFAAFERVRAKPASKAALSTEPPSTEQNKKIGEILGNSKGMNADQLKFAFDEAEIEPRFSAPYITNRRADDEVNAKNSIENTKLDRKEAITFHKESEEYHNTLEKDAKNAKIVLSAVEQAREAVKSGKVKPLSLANIFKGLGTVGNKISEALINDKQAALQAAIPEFLHGRKEVFGIRLSDADLALIQDKLPSIGKNEEANTEILKILEKYAKKSLLKEQAGKNVLEKYGTKSSGGKLRPLNYTSRVEEEYDKLVENEGKFESLPPATQYKGKKIKDSKTGQILQSNGETWAPI